MTRARHSVRSYLEDAGFPGPLRGDVELAVTEAVTNACVHAYAGARRTGAVRVHVALDSADLVICVEDDGGGLKPRADSPGLGLGLQLIAAVTRRVETSPAAARGTRIVMTFGCEASRIR